MYVYTYICMYMNSKREKDKYSFIYVYVYSRLGPLFREPSLKGFRKNTLIETLTPRENLAIIERNQQKTLMISLLENGREKFPCFLSIKHGENRDIIATVMAIDSTFHSIIKLPFTLSTFALIDNEAATEFIENIVPKLYLEIPYNYDSMIKPKLKMSGEYIR
jgi:hypothetical protein